MLIFSLSNSFVEMRDCTPLYADSFDLNACHSQVSFAGINVGVVRRYAPPFSTLRIRSIGHPFQKLSDARTLCLGRPFVHLSDVRTHIRVYGRWVETLL